MKPHMDIVTTKGRNARLYRGTPKADAPKSYEHIDTLGTNLASNYSSGVITLYKNKKGILKYAIYRDGCFYPYYGTFEYLD